MKNRFAAAAWFAPTAILLTLGAGRGAAGTIFTDNFPGTGLNPAWQVLQGQGYYNVNNELIYGNRGPLSSPSGWSTTSLSLGLPFWGTAWQINTAATYSLDWCTLGNNYTGPSVPTQYCSSGAQQDEILVAFASVTQSDRSALAGNNVAGIGRGVDAWYGDNHLSAWYGGTTTDNLLPPADSLIRDNIAGGTYWYRIARDGGSLTMAVSADGINYATALSATLANPANPFNELVLTGTTYLTENSSSTYPFVNIESTGVTDAPEPGGLLLTVLGAACVGLGRLRRGSRPSGTRPF